MQRITAAKNLIFRVMLSRNCLTRRLYRCCEASPTPNRLQIQPLANPFVRSLPVLHKQVAAFLLAAKGKVGRGTRCPSLIIKPQITTTLCHSELQLSIPKNTPPLRRISCPEPPATLAFGKKQGVILSGRNPSRRLYHRCEGSPCGSRLQIQPLASVAPPPWLHSFV